MDDKYAWLKDKNWNRFKHCDYTFESNRPKQFIEKQTVTFQKFINNNQKNIDAIEDEIGSRVSVNAISMLSYINGSIFYFKRKCAQDRLPVLYCSQEGKIDTPILDLNVENNSNKILLFSAYRVSKFLDNVAYSFYNDGEQGLQLRVKNIIGNESSELSSIYASGIFEWISNATLLFVEYDSSYSYQHLYLYNTENKTKQKLDLNNDIADKTQNILIEYALDNELVISFYVNDKKGYIQFSTLLGQAAILPLYFDDCDQTYFKLARLNQDLIALRKNCNGQIEVVKGSVNNSRLEPIKWQSVFCSNEFLEVSDFRITSDGILIEVLNCETATNVFYAFSVDGERHEFTFNESVYSAYFPTEQIVGGIIVKFSTPLIPSRYYLVDICTGTLSCIYEEHSQNIEIEKYIVERKYANSKDGMSIPLTIIYDKQTKIDSTASTVINVYGAYCVSLLPDFNVGLFSLLDRGVIYCIAHVRGGGEKGLKWHKLGRLDNKINSINDLIDTSGFLIENNYTSAGLIGLMSASAGGIVAGGIFNKIPKLIKAAVLDAPFVDVLNSLSDKKQDMTPSDWLEFGDPLTDNHAYKNIRSYCPYQNIKAHEYPSILFNIALCDGNVGYWESLKYYSKIKEYQTNCSAMLINIDRDTTHAGCTDVPLWRMKMAISYFFLLNELEVKYD